jgi:hypothetical protein
MKSIIVSLCVLICLGSSLALAMGTRCFPKNNLALYDNPNRIFSMNEEEFNSIVDHVIALWQPWAKLHGATLVGEKNWQDGTVNAYADQKGKTWTVHMFGGLARRPEVTQDGFALVVCHELGHHFGGHYFYESNSWAAAEGQADYFATQVCGKKVFERAKAYNIRYRQGVPKAVQDRCDAIYHSKEDQELCYRQAAGGLSLATLLATLGRDNPPKFETPDSTAVGQTNTDHPKSQCRLDTYFQASLCPTAFDYKVIPGKDMGSSSNNSTAAEAESAKYSCFQATGFQLGYRPTCWFKPQARLW